MKDQGKREPISIDEACSILCGSVPETGEEMCGLDESLERILARDLCAKMSQPPFRRSAMDGYALRSSDAGEASLEEPACLHVAGRLFAGDAPLPAGSLKQGEAVRIMTGAPVPDDADCVIRQEDTDLGEETVQIYASAEEMQNVCPVGEDFAAGECLCEKGAMIDAYVLSCACAAGVTSLPVRRRIRAGLIMTGDELTRPGEPLTPGKIYNSSEAFLKARLRQLGCTPEASLFIGDDEEKIREAIADLAGKTDLIVTTGGVSVGVKDLIPAALESLGAELLFHGIRIKPGMPTLAAVYKGTPVLGLSGNPYSAAAIFELLGVPLLHRMSGAAGETFAQAEAALASDVMQSGKVPRVMMGIFDGTRVSVFGRQRNAQMKFGAGSNCIVILPPGKRVFSEGEKLKILLQRRPHAAPGGGWTGL